MKQELAWPALTPESFGMFAQKVHYLIASEECKPLDWYHAYQASREFRQVVDTFAVGELGIFLISGSRQRVIIGLSDDGVMNQAMVGFNALLTIKTFNEAIKSYKTKPPKVALPEHIETFLPDLIQHPSVYDYPNFIPHLNQIWNHDGDGYNPQEIQEGAIELLIRMQDALYSKDYGGSPNYSQVKRIDTCLGIDEDTLDWLYAWQPDMHYYNSAISQLQSALSLKVSYIKEPLKYRGSFSQ